MAKTKAQLEKDCQATLKLIFEEMEALSAMEPQQAYPYEYVERRRKVMRKVWGLFKEATAYRDGDG